MRAAVVVSCIFCAASACRPDWGAQSRKPTSGTFEFDGRTRTDRLWEPDGTELGMHRWK